MTVVDELKPCPFCRGEARWLEEPDEPDAPFGLVVDHTENCFLGGRMMAEWDQICAAWDTRPAPDGDEETYRIGVDDGRTEMAREIDQATGGDGEFRYCMNGDPDRHCPDAEAMKARIIERFAHPPRNDAVVEALRDAMALRAHIERTEG